MSYQKRRHQAFAKYTFIFRLSCGHRIHQTILGCLICCYWIDGWQCSIVSCLIHRDTNSKGTWEREPGLHAGWDATVVAVGGTSSDEFGLGGCLIVSRRCASVQHCLPRSVQRMINVSSLTEMKHCADWLNPSQLPASEWWGSRRRTEYTGVSFLVFFRGALEGLCATNDVFTQTRLLSWWRRHLRKKWWCYEEDLKTFQHTSLKIA